MSLSILLVPVAFSAIAAGVATLSKGGGQTTCQVQTRMRNVDLVQAALEQVGATVTREDGTLVAAWDDVECRLTQDEQGSWVAHFPDGVAEETAVERIRQLDAAYGECVQQHVLATLRQRATSANLAISSETVEQDRSVVVVLDVQQVAS